MRICAILFMVASLLHSPLEAMDVLSVPSVDPVQYMPVPCQIVSFDCVSSLEASSSVPQTATDPNAIDAVATNRLPSIEQPNAIPSVRRWGLKHSNWYLNTEVTALSALGGTSTQEYLLEDLIAPATIAPFASNTTSSQLTASPRLTFGKSHSNGWGIQSSYWDFQAISGNSFAGPLFNPSVLPDLNIISEQDRTRAYTFDLEATKRFSCGKTDFIGTIGARHGALKRSVSSFVFGESVQNDAYTLSSLSESSFHGTGLTYSMLGIRQTSLQCFSWYGGSRLSHLFGNNSAIAQTSATLTRPNASAISTNGAIDSDNDSLFIAQFQTGAMWTKGVNPWGGQLFARSGFEYQYWNSSSLSAISTSFAGRAGSSIASVAADAGDLKTQFVGFAFGAGYAW
jgi:hypothetical protein